MHAPTIPTYRFERNPTIPHPAHTHGRNLHEVAHDAAESKRPRSKSRSRRSPSQPHMSGDRTVPSSSAHAHAAQPRQRHAAQPPAAASGSQPGSQRVSVSVSSPGSADAQKRGGEPNIFRAGARTAGANYRARRLFTLSLHRSAAARLRLVRRRKTRPRLRQTRRCRPFASPLASHGRRFSARRARGGA